MLTVHEHTKQINDIQMYKDQTMFVTASKDHTAKVGVESMPGQNGTQLCELFFGKKKKLTCKSLRSNVSAIPSAKCSLRAF